MKKLIKNIKDLPEEHKFVILMGSIILVSLTIGINTLLKNEGLVKLEDLIIHKLYIFAPFINIAFISCLVKLSIGWIVKKFFILSIYGNEKNTFGTGNFILNIIIKLF
ncbi:hypothetical protein [Clostridium baratii]|uniref:hypothetical protein n=1 Tax=Clostridium baratii TaxID=1561 RepID=UPI0005F2C22E|nr:hypothetical protein [Clostridium baratii]AQM58597.1 hypothetical protein NPD11_3023 [Clostridium baratii]KJU71541.1 hypothetical protein UC77_08995 [Clostridium baratii]